mmetsp:Transcript_8454/g.22647  ORF Transcript_8454/g.22647 Transcript_8454/m.22647 type:complete len:246 (+) Transcript_8454:926-1663(+)
MVTLLARATAVSDFALRSVLVASHLWPIPRRAEVVRNDEIVGLHGLQLEVLCVDHVLRHVGNPHGLLVAVVHDPEARAGLLEGRLLWLRLLLWRRRVCRAVEGHLVLRPRWTCPDAHAVVVGVAVHAWAHGVHRLHVASPLNDAILADLGVGATVRRARGASEIADQALRANGLGGPFRVGELAAGRVATRNLVPLGIDCLQVVSGKPQIFGAGAVVHGQVRAVHHLVNRASLSGGVAVAITLDG